VMGEVMMMGKMIDGNDGRLEDDDEDGNLIVPAHTSTLKPTHHETTFTVFDVYFK
jgi:hypothetical protein